MAEDKQVFISSYLQDLHLHVPGLKLVKDFKFGDSKFCRIVEDPLLYQQSLKQMFYKCNINFMISRVCFNFQIYKPICLPYNHEELILTPELLLDYGLVHQVVCLDPSQALCFGTVEDPLLYQQSLKQMFYKCNINFMISRVCFNFQIYKPICLPYNHEELILTPELLLDYGLVHQVVCLD